jgi:hypothetical protein
MCFLFGVSLNWGIRFAKLFKVVCIAFWIACYYRVLLINSITNTFLWFSALNLLVVHIWLEEWVKSNWKFRFIHWYQKNDDLLYLFIFSQRSKQSRLPFQSSFQLPFEAFNPHFTRRFSSHQLVKLSLTNHSELQVKTHSQFRFTHWSLQFQSHFR